MEFEHILYENDSKDPDEVRAVLLAWRASPIVNRSFRGEEQIESWVSKRFDRFLAYAAAKALNWDREDFVWLLSEACLLIGCCTDSTPKLRAFAEFVIEWTVTQICPLELFELMCGIQDSVKSLGREDVHWVDEDMWNIIGTYEDIAALRGMITKCMDKTAVIERMDAEFLAVKCANSRIKLNNLVMARTSQLSKLRLSERQAAYLHNMLHIFPWPLAQLARDTLDAMRN